MKLCYPSLGALGIVLETLCKQEQLEYVKPSDEREEALRIGSRLSPEGVCLPMKRMVGEFVLAARQGADTALFLGGSGPCRFGYFAPMIQTILDQNQIHMKVLPMEAPSGDRIRFIKDLAGVIGCSEGKAGRLLIQGWNAMRWLDRWEKIRLDALAVTGKTGPRPEAAERFDSLTHQLRRWCKEWKTEIPADHVQVGIVGDIYTTVDQGINQDLQERLAMTGIVTRRSIELSRYMLHLLTGNRIQNHAAKPYLPRGIGGFARETIGASRQMIRKGFDGLIQVYPLSCMPEIVADGILIGLQEDSGVAVMRLIIDEHSGQTGNQTRLEAFADMLQRRKGKG